jgi:Ca2+-binding RTX toxin-like protein
MAEGLSTGKSKAEEGPGLRMVRGSAERGAYMDHTRRVTIIVASTVALVAVFLVYPQAANAARPHCFGKRATIVGTAKADVLKGTSRPDVIVGLAGNDVLKGLGGNDRICGGKGNDNLIGKGGNDLLAGEGGKDKLAGGAGTFDFLVGGPGGDGLSGGAGIGDMAGYFGAPGPVTTNLAAGTATGDGSDTLTGVEDVDGSRFDDVITGNAASNFLFGEAGNDTLSGGDGDFDGVIGGEGDDSLDGGSGEDFASFYSSPVGVAVNLTPGTAIGEGTDTLANIEDVEGSKHDDSLTGDPGQNVFWPSLGNDVVDGSTGPDKVSYRFAQRAVTANLNTGTATGEGTDTLIGIENLIGSRQNDNLTGDAGSNVLHGLAGDDILSGDAGDDTLNGGEGADTLDGGKGSDTCDGESEVNCEP